MSQAEEHRLALAQALDTRILSLISDWRTTGVTDETTVNALFLDLAQYQAQFNAPYERYLRHLQIDISRIASWQHIPPVPARSMKEYALAAFPIERAARIFQTSGTTQHQRGRHYLETTSVYDAASSAIFDRLVLATLPPSRPPLRILSIVPNPRERPESSLGHMVANLMHEYSDTLDGWFAQSDRLHIPALHSAIVAAHTDDRAVCLFGTALAYAQLLEHSATALPLPEGSFIIETGGFKGMRRRIERKELYEKLAERCNVSQTAIIAEFGMTELCSQYYDELTSRGGDAPRKIGPPWLRTRIVDTQGCEVPIGTIGSLQHFDLANRSSICAVSTEDLAVGDDTTFVLIGREATAEPRGCSLDAEALQ